MIRYFPSYDRTKTEEPMCYLFWISSPI